MPEALERELRARARKKGFSGERADAYVYGTMRKTGWQPTREKKKHHITEAMLSAMKHRKRR